MAIALLGLSTATLAQTVKGKYPACRSDDALDRLTSAVASNDRDSFMAIMMSGECTTLPSGARVSLRGGGFSTAKVMYKGQTYYVPREEVGN